MGISQLLFHICHSSTISRETLCKEIWVPAIFHRRDIDHVEHQSACASCTMLMRFIKAETPVQGWGFWALFLTPFFGSNRVLFKTANNITAQLTRDINTVNWLYTIHMTLMMTSAQVVETSVNVTNNSPSRDYSHPDDQTTQTTETPGFKPFTVLGFYPFRLCADACGFNHTHSKPWQS